MESFTISTTPAVEAGAYAVGDLIGGLQTLANVVDRIGEGGYIEAGALLSQVAVANAVTLLFFNANPSASTFTENSAPVIHANDRAKLIGAMTLSVQAAIGTPNVRFADNPHIPFCLPVGKDLFMCAVAGGALTPGATADLTFCVGIRRDRPR